MEKLTGIISTTNLVMLFSKFEKEELEMKFGYLMDKNTCWLIMLQFMSFVLSNFSTEIKIKVDETK